MDFRPTPTQRGLVSEVGDLLDDELVSDPRRAFRALGERRLLAVHYPVDYGGRGLGVADHAAVSEELGRRGLPDEAHLVTTQGVGCTLLSYGTQPQRARWLPGIASGEVMASLLLSERHAGSEISAVETQALKTPDGYVVNGVKSWNLHAQWSTVGLCSVRTRAAGRYDSISLLIIPLDAPGVSVTPVARAAGQPYFDVHLDDVHVPMDALVGREDKGWALIVRAIGFERAGFDYLSRASRWLGLARAAVAKLPAGQSGQLAPGLLQLQSRIATARALAYGAVTTSQGLDIDELGSAYAKLACGEAAQLVAWWAAEHLDLYADPGLLELQQAVAEAPELTISGGASELLLDLIASDLPSADDGAHAGVRG